MKPFLSASLLILSLSALLGAQGLQQEKLVNRTRIAKQSSTINGDRGLFTVPSVETLNPGQFSFGAGWNNVDRTPKDLDVNTFPVHLSVGVFSRLTVSAMLETRKQITARNLGQVGFYNSLPFVSTRFSEGIGDTTLAVKYRLERKSDNVGGIALKGFVKFGTADSDKGLGTQRHDVGAEVIFSSLLPLNFVVHSNIGYVATSNTKTPFVRTLKDELRTGLGTAWPSTGIGLGGGSRLQAVFEYANVTFVGCCGAANATTGKIQNPSDIVFGIRYFLLNQGLTFDAGYRDNIKFDETNPNNKDSRGIIAAVTFTLPNSVNTSSNRDPLVGIEANVTDIPSTGTATLTATGFDADNDALTYVWTATAGQVTGSGATVTYRPAGAGRHTVRVTVSDGKGGTGTEEIEITVR